MSFELFKIKCNQCGHEWIPRIEDPRICPGCHSLRFDKERKTKPPKEVCVGE